MKQSTQNSVNADGGGSRPDGTSGGAIKQDYLVDVLSLSAAQLEATIEYAKEQENQCTQTLLRVLKSIDGAAVSSPVDSDSQNATKLDDESIVGDVRKAVLNGAKEAIVSLQFVDALSQRLAHLLFELQQITEFAESPVRLASENEWRSLLEKIRAMYSISDERAVFDAVMNKAPIGQLLAVDEAEGDGGYDAIELF